MTDKRTDMDETIFPTAHFRGRWELGEPEFWERFTICLFGENWGDFLTEPEEIHKALQASGYRLTLSPIDEAPTNTEEQD